MRRLLAAALLLSFTLPASASSYGQDTSKQNPRPPVDRPPSAPPAADPAKEKETEKPKWDVANPPYPFDVNVLPVRHERDYSTR